LGAPGWRDDQRCALNMGRRADPVAYGTMIGWVYNPSIALGVLMPDDHAIDEIEEALRIAERSGDDFGLALVGLTLGDALVHRPSTADRIRGEKLLTEISDLLLRLGQNLGALPIVNAYLARERARRGSHDEALPLMRAAVDELVRAGQLLGWGIPATGVLVESLLDRGAADDVVEADGAFERLAAAPSEGLLVMRDIWLLRLRALLARARGDNAAYADLKDRYRDMAEKLGFEGHIAWADAMP
jgi:hypothetical protein